MRALVLLALFSVCNANFFMHVMHKTDTDTLIDAQWDFLQWLTGSTEEYKQEMRASEMGQEINAVITETVNAAKKALTTLHSHMDPFYENFMAQFTQQVEQLKARLEKDITTMSPSLQPWAEQIVAKIKEQVEELRTEVDFPAEAIDPEYVKTILMKKTQELKAQLDSGVSQMQAQMVPYTEDMQEKMQQSLDEFQKNMMPMAQSFQTQLTQKFQEIQQSLVPLEEEMKATYKNLEARLAALRDSFTQSTQ